MYVNIKDITILLIMGFRIWIIPLNIKLQNHIHQNLPLKP